MAGMDTDAIAKRKSETRRRLIAERDAIDPAVRMRADESIARRVAELPAFEDAELLLTYLDVGSEVRTRDLIERAWSGDKVVALPRCVRGTREVTWHSVDSYDQLEMGSYGLLEPSPNFAPLVDPMSYAQVLALVPGLTFDSRGYRIGYGGGYYDVFLSSFAGTSVGLCRARSMTEDLLALGLVSLHDLPVNMVMTD